MLRLLKLGSGCMLHTKIVAGMTVIMPGHSERMVERYPDPRMTPPVDNHCAFSRT